MKENNYVSIVLYYHNVDHSVIDNFANQLYEGLLVNFKNYEVIIANDSQDSEGLDLLIAALNKFAEHNTITVIDFPEYIGVETAMMAGDDLTIGDYIYEFDNLNIEFDKKLLMETYRLTMEGNDVVSVGPREADTSFFSKIFYKIYNKSVSTKQKLHTEVFRILSRRAFNRAKAMAKVISYRKAIYAASGMKHCYLADESVHFLAGHDKNEEKMRWKLGFNSLMLFTNTIQKFSVFISCFFLVIVVAITAYIVLVFALGKPVAGWTPIMMYLSICFFGIFSLFAIVLKYLSIILDMVYHKNTYIIESIRKV